MIGITPHFTGWQPVDFQYFLAESATPVEVLVMPLPLDEITTVSMAVQQSLDYRSLRDAIGFVCMWDAFRRTGTTVGEPCYGTVVAELLKVYGIDVDKFRSA